jgi:UDP-N-acetylmuramoyl-L-alanyl-D-glutamate--2,6-diaminopimelate ligase
MEAYYRAKADLFVSERCRLAVINVDDPWGRRLQAEVDVPVLTYTLADAEGLVLGARRSRFRWRGQDVDLPLGGRHNVSNALAAATAAESLGIDRSIVAAGLRAAPPVPGRWELVEGDQPFTVVVDYAHTPDGLTQVLDAARGVVGDRRVVVVFGCGGDRDRAKRPRMAAAATAAADLTVLTSDNPRHEDPLEIIAEARAGATPGRALLVEPDRRAAIAAALERARPGDVVVIAGKGHETVQDLGDRVVPFDDREVARRLLRERRRW